MLACSLATRLKKSNQKEVSLSIINTFFCFVMASPSDRCECAYAFTTDEGFRFHDEEPPYHDLTFPLLLFPLPNPILLQNPDFFTSVLPWPLSSVTFTSTPPCLFFPLRGDTAGWLGKRGEVGGRREGSFDESDGSGVVEGDVEETLMYGPSQVGG